MINEKIYFQMLNTIWLQIQTLWRYTCVWATPLYLSWNPNFNFDLNESIYKFVEVPQKWRYIFGNICLFYLKTLHLLREKWTFKTKIVFIKQNSHWLSQLVNTCDRSRSSVTSNLMIECFTTIINGWKLIFKSRSRNPNPFLLL